MEPTILSKDTKQRGKGNGRLHFIIDNIDVSIINGLRRVITSNIPTLVFRGFPDKDNQINIKKNTTKFNNEYLKHRISCIPIMNQDESTFSSFCNLYQVELNMTNDTLEQIYVTTEHLNIIDKTSQKPIKDGTHTFFPPDPISGEYILICILYPNQNSQEENESIHFVANIDQGTALECSCWNVVNHCAYQAVIDESEVSTKLLEISDKVKKEDFKLLDAQRCVKPNQYEFSVETIGIYDNDVLIYKACQYILSRLSQINNYMIQQNGGIQRKHEHDQLSNDGTLSQEQRVELQKTYCSLYKEDLFYIFEIKEDDYTIGKIIENHFYNMYQEYVSFVGFKKEHPTKKEAYIYIKYKTEQDEANIVNQFIELVQFLNRIIISIQKEFSTKS